MTENIHVPPHCIQQQEIWHLISALQVKTRGKHIFQGKEPWVGSGFLFLLAPFLRQSFPSTIIFFFCVALKKNKPGLLSFFPFTCIKSLPQLLDLVGGPWFSVNALCVQPMHFYVVDQLLHQHWHSSLLAGQPGELHAKLSRWELGIILTGKRKMQKNWIFSVPSRIPSDWIPSRKQRVNVQAVSNHPVYLQVTSKGGQDTPGP